MNQSPTLSIIVPVYNEAEGIAGFLQKLIDATRQQTQVKTEIIVVDDGSLDRCPEILAGISGIRLVTHKHNYGYGAALKSGISLARSPTIAIIDGDNSYNPRDIFRLLPEISRFDMVVGLRKGKVMEQQRLRRFAKWFMKRLASYLTQTRIPDLNSGLRIIDKAAVEKYRYLLPDSFSFTTTITLAILSNRGRVRYLPIDFHQRTGRSQIRPIQDSLLFFYQILTTVLCFKPARIFMPIAFLFFLLGFFIAGFSIYYLKRFMDVSTVLCLIASLQFGGISLLAEQNVRLSRKD